MKLRLPLMVAVSALARPLALNAQAALEYATKVVGGSGDTGGGTIAGCPISSETVTCLSRLYPRTALAVGVVAALLLYRALFRRRA